MSYLETEDRTAPRASSSSPSALLEMEAPSREPDAFPDMATASWQPAPALIVGLTDLAEPFADWHESRGLPCLACDPSHESLRLARGARADVILLGDSDSERSTGEGDLELLKDLRQACPNALILYLADSFCVDRASALMDLGADDVIPPPHTLRSVLLRIAVQQHRRSLGTSGNRIQQGDAGTIMLDPGSRLLRWRGRTVSLTRRELELLERLRADEGRAVSRDRILSDIWGEGQDSESVLDATVHRLRRKLERDPSNPRTLRTVRGIGYRLEENRVGVLM
jgi:DNA-binding response OmpR family regulator